MTSALALAGMVGSGVAPRPTVQLTIDKSDRSLTLFEDGKAVKTFKIALGPKPKGAKSREGDMATPEGDYFVCVKNPKSRFHLSLGISYPGPLDAERGLKTGAITKSERDRIVRADRKGITPPWDTELGGEIFIHGGGTTRDWTHGCVALDDADIEYVYKRASVGTKVRIVP